MTNVVGMAHRNGLPRQLTRERCTEWVRELVAEGGRVIFRPHAFQRSEERQITNAQVFSVLRRGEIVDGPDWSDEYENWVFCMKADTAGEEVTVSAAIEIERLMGQVVAVITVF